MSDRPFWSVIVPTYQREEVLCETIEYLLGLSYPHYELLVIDQTPRHEKETEQFLRVCERRFPQRFRWHFIAKANLPHARNVGAEMAKGEYLLYCDDDIIPPVDLIELHQRSLNSPGVGAVTGGVHLDRKPASATTSSPSKILGDGRVANSPGRGPSSTDSLWGGNMSMARQLVFDVGLFDEAYIGNAYREETDFSLRVKQRVISSFLIYAAAIVHLGHPTGGARASKVAGEGKYLFELHHNIAYFFAKNFQQRYCLSFLERELRWFAKERSLFLSHPNLFAPALRGLWRGYWAGLRRRKQ